ncbi:hypothetical protein K431DRAFT_286502 [Polychaeton citri CBS 116435]|uniref:Uncharacterized protein n=1 Tax=Polychaeton citri CBS 116435 TaxID=1314669 RepID=A0A9P4Q521_9PEZI|nr:hypothetical protein K431DRAFT_286502 [Polychaeton citri CBS 116435]
MSVGRKPSHDLAAGSPPAYDDATAPGHRQPAYTTPSAECRWVGCTIKICKIREARNHNLEIEVPRAVIAPIRKESTYSSVRITLQHQAREIGATQSLSFGHSLHGIMLLCKTVRSERSPKPAHSITWIISEHQWRWAKAELLHHEENASWTLCFHVNAIYDSSLSYRKGFSLLRKLLPSEWRESREDLPPFSTDAARMKKRRVQQDLGVMIGSQVAAST